MPPTAPQEGRESKQISMFADLWRKLPSLRSRALGAPAFGMEKPQKSAIFRNWHGFCKDCFIRRKDLGQEIRGFEMTATSNFSQRLFAVFAAFGMTALMLTATFQAPSAHAIQVMFA